MGSRRILLAAVVVLFWVSVADAQRWWNHNWQYRRLVTLDKIEPLGLAGDEIAVVTMPTGGLVAADQSDIRVVTGGGNVVKHRVLMVGPGDRIRLAFAIHGKTTTYNVYYGNSNPNPKRSAADILDIRRGVLHEVWEYPGGTAGNFPQAQSVHKNATKLIGANFRKGMFLGHNPFGPQKRIVSVFTGHFRMKQSDECEFVCTARGASFLLIDDKLIYSAGGWRGIQRRFRRGPKVKLAEGLHKMTLYHICTGGDPIAIAAWRSSAMEFFRVFPPSLFTKVHVAKAGPMKQYGLATGIDFIPQFAGETFTNNRYFQRYTFNALKVGKGPHPPKCKWDFGDGHVAEGWQVEHVYLADGIYTVTLEARTYHSLLKRTNRIHVSRPWDRVIHRRLDRLKRHAKIVSQYNFKTLHSHLAGPAMVLLKRAGMAEPLLRAGKDFLTRSDVKGKDIKSAVTIYADELLAQSEANQAVEALIAGAKRADAKSNVRAELLVKAAGIRLEQLSDADGAMQLFQRVDNHFASAPFNLLDQAREGIGDVWRIRGDYNKARQAYSRISVSVVDPAEAALRRGNLAMRTEAYIQKRDYVAAEESLQKWRDTFPLCKLEGYWSLLRVKLFLARKLYAAAARECEILTAVNPMSGYSAELLKLSAVAYTKLGLSEKAAAAIERIETEYPESPQAGVNSEK